MAIVQLEKYDAVLCSAYAAQFCWNAHRIGAKKHHGYTSSRNFEQTMAHYFVGCMAEAACCRHYGMRYDLNLDGLHSADLDGLCEVKGSTHKRSNLLIYDSQYHPDKLMVHVRLMDDFKANLVGWIFGREAAEVWEERDSKRGGFDTPCKLVRWQHLKPIESMPMDGRRFARG